MIATLLWIGIGNAALHLPVGIVYGLAVLVALLAWNLAKPQAGTDSSR